jgi:hypothetical protein
MLMTSGRPPLIVTGLISPGRTARCDAGPRTLARFRAANTTPASSTSRSPRWRLTADEMSDAGTEVRTAGAALLVHTFVVGSKTNAPLAISAQ